MCVLRVGVCCKCFYVLHNTAALETGEITAVMENSGKGSHILYNNQEKNIFGT